MLECSASCLKIIGGKTMNAGYENCVPSLPNWVPLDAKNYLVHTEMGCSIRALAREAGCHASTIMRQVHKVEARRDDPLVDEALNRLGRINRKDIPAPAGQPSEDTLSMKDQTPHSPDTPDQATIDREARRILRRLSEPGACLAVAKDMDKAVVVRDLPDGRTTRTAVLERAIAQALALKEWIACGPQGRITRYHITQAGRAALRKLLAADESARAGFGEAPANFEGAWDESDLGEEQAGNKQKRVRYNVAESPVQTLSRRRDRDGTSFLNPELVAAAERLREDFELAQMGPNVTQNWDHFLTGGTDGNGAAKDAPRGPTEARERVAKALADLGPGLGDVALRCCCFLEGMEAAEKRMGWSARSGKIVLRIALQRLKRHYEEHGGSYLIG